MRPPEDVDWFIHRILTDTHYHVSPRDLEELTVEDVFDMNCVIDAIEANESFANAEMDK